MPETVGQVNHSLAGSAEEPIPTDMFVEGLPVATSHAPGRLDVMGGISDYCGGLAIGLPLARGVSVGVQPRRDGLVLIRSTCTSDGHDSRTTRWSLQNLQSGEGLRNAGDFAARLRRLGDEWSLPLAGVLHGLLEFGHLATLADGYTLVVRSDLHAASGTGAVGAAQVALIESVSSLLSLHLSDEQVVAICGHASRAVAGLPLGGAVPVVAMRGRGDRLLSVDCRLGSVCGHLPVPDAVCFVGVDSGVKHRLAGQKQAEVRTAAAMGARMIEEMSGAAPTPPATGMNLSRISTQDYVSRVRDRLPTKILGEDFLDRYGPLTGGEGPVQADTIYKVRSRTEHHIYEHERSRQFARTLRQAALEPHAERFALAGQLMTNSHWSYGQRCGLGTVQTDLFVNMLQQRGLKRGVFGARISGAGAGGMVVVMLARNDRSREAVEDAMDEYRARTHSVPTLYTPGGCGVRRQQTPRSTSISA